MPIFFQNTVNILQYIYSIFLKAKPYKFLS